MDNHSTKPNPFVDSMNKSKLEDDLREAERLVTAMTKEYLNKCDEHFKLLEEANGLAWQIETHKKTFKAIRSIFNSIVVFLPPKAISWTKDGEHYNLLKIIEDLTR